MHNVVWHMHSRQRHHQTYQRLNCRHRHLDKYYLPHQLDQYIRDHPDLLRDYDSHSTINAAHVQQLQELRADAEGVEH